MFRKITLQGTVNCKKTLLLFCIFCISENIDPENLNILWLELPLRFKKINKYETGHRL
jgi:hypothetical protein